MTSASDAPTPNLGPPDQLFQPTDSLAKIKHDTTETAHGWGDALELTRAVEVAALKPMTKLERVKRCFKQQDLGHAAWWVALLLLHLANIAYYLLVVIIYRQLSTLYINMKIEQLSIAMPAPYHGRIAFAHAVIAAVHALMVVLMLVGTLTSGRLVYYPSPRLLGSVVRYASRRLSRRSSSTTSSSTKVAGVDATPKRPHIKPKNSTLPRRLVAEVLRLTTYWFGATGIFGVNGKYFEWVTYARELLESVLQTVQAYRMTLLLPRPWLNRGYVGLIVINSVAIPLVHKYYHGSSQKRRLITLLIDSLLDIASSIGVPIILFITYAKQYTDPARGFPFTNWLDDVWVNHVTHEFQLMMVVSWSDLASRMVFALGLLLCMDGIKDLLMLPQDTKPPSLAITSKEDVEKKTKKAAERRTSSFRQAIEKRGGTVMVMSKAVNIVFAIWALGVVAVHITAEVTSTNDACRLQLRPWFGTKPACAILEIDCSLIDSRGHGEVMDKAWTRFDAEMIFQVTLRHCTELQVSPAILSFNNLNTFKVYNSTVESWTSDAALVSSAHEKLKFIYLVRTNFTNAELPAGMLSADFPKTVTILTVCKSNLVALPDDVDTKWPRLITIVFEFSPLTVIPPSIIRLEPYALSFAGTQITSLPVEMLGIQGNEYVHIGGTPITRLPQTVPKLSSTLWSFRISKTNVSVLWKWMDPLIQRAYRRGPYSIVSATGSPLCAEFAEILAGNRSQFSTNETDLAQAMDVSTPDKLAYTKAAIGCATSMDSFYPLAFDDYQQKKASAELVA